MASTIKVKRSAVSGNAPNTSNIDTGELALNTADGILYSSDGSSVFEIGANLTSLSVTGQVTLTNIISANGGLGTAGQALLTDGSSKVYWGTVASGSSSGAAAGIRTSYYYTANEGDTTFTGADDNANVANLDRAYVDVFVNGILISPTNYTSNTTAVVFTSGVSNNDIVTLLASDVVAGDVAKTYVYSANGTQTIFDGADLDGQTLTITTEHYDVYVNGLLIWDNANNYTSNSSAVEFTTTLADNDIVTIKTYEIAPGRAVLTGIDDNSTAVAVTIDSSNRVGINETTPNYNLDVGGSLGVNSLYIGDVQVTASAAEINLLDGLTANTSELNLLDGVTATTAEINYLDGVTSNIQTQIDNISSSFTLAADNGANDTFNTDETLTFTGGTGIDTTVANNEITIAIDSTVGTITSSTGAAIIPSGTTAQRDGSPVAGYLRFNTSDSSFEGYDGSAWGAIGGTATTNHLELDDISGSFDGANTNFSLTVSSSAVSPTSAAHLLISINGIVQEPTTVYTVSGSTITFTTAPQSGDTFFGVFYESLNIGTPGNGTVGTAQLSSANVAFDTSTLFIDSTNNRVGVGTITPGRTLHVNGGTSDTVLRLESSDANVFMQFADGNTTYEPHIGAKTNDLVFLKGASGFGEAMRIDSSGDVGIGTTSPSEKLEVSGAAKVQNVYLGGGGGLAGTIGYSDSSSSIALYSGSHGTTPNIMVFNTNTSERMRIDSSGNLLVGTTDVNNNTSDGIRIKADGTLQLRSDNSDFTALINRSNASDGEIIRLQKSNTTVGSIANDGLDTITIGSGDVAVAFQAGADAITPWNTSGVIRDNAIDLGRSISRFKDLYLSGGAYVGGTGSANYLDDYEEGTWTPSLAGSSGTPSHTINSRSGYYRKIGDLVFVSMSWDASNISGGSGDFYFTGLPFSDAGITGGRGSAQYYQVGGYNPAAAIYGGNAIGGIVNVSAVNSTWRWGVTSDLSSRSIISYNMFYVAS